MVYILFVCGVLDLFVELHLFLWAYFVFLVALVFFSNPSTSKAFIDIINTHMEFPYTAPDETNSASDQMNRSPAIVALQLLLRLPAPTRALPLRTGRLRVD